MRTSSSVQRCCKMSVLILSSILWEKQGWQVKEFQQNLQCLHSIELIQFWKMSWEWMSAPLLKSNVARDPFLMVKSAKSKKLFSENLRCTLKVQWGRQVQRRILWKLPVRKLVKFTKFIKVSECFPKGALHRHHGCLARPSKQYKSSKPHGEQYQCTPWRSSPTV